VSGDVASVSISVILPNYNHAKWVGRALEALLAQDPAAEEIIVIDDASTDDSIAVIERFAADSPSIIFLRNPKNLGVVATLERGLRLARGTHIYFAAADDFVLRGFFETALRRLDANPDLGLFCGGTVLIEGRTNRPFAMRPAVWPRINTGRVDPVRVCRLLKTTDNWILTGSSVFRRECVLWAGGFDDRLGPFADGILGRKIALKFGFFFETMPVATWVIFSDSQSRRVALDQNITRHFLDVVPDWIAADPVFPSWYVEMFRNRARFSACRLVLQRHPLDRNFVLTIGARSAAERSAIEKLVRLPEKLARLAILALLWYRLKPIALTAVLRTMISLRVTSLAFGRRFGQTEIQIPSAFSDGG
jgi:glycosyltransferase involved in cell wall biosynthesis